jgi:hypothetical protein
VPQKHIKYNECKQCKFVVLGIHRSAYGFVLR